MNDLTKLIEIVNYFKLTIEDFYYQKDHVRFVFESGKAGMLISKDKFNNLPNFHIYSINKKILTDKTIKYISPNRLYYKENNLGKDITLELTYEQAYLIFKSDFCFTVFPINIRVNMIPHIQNKNDQPFKFKLKNGDLEIDCEFTIGSNYLLLTMESKFRLYIYSVKVGDNKEIEQIITYVDSDGDNGIITLEQFNNLVKFAS